MKRNENQLKAINSKGNVIVSAGAGSGKTSVLTERIFINIKNGVKLDELLILTFTEAAAKEMKIRLKDALLKDPELADLSPLVDSANISTFDAYFLYLLKKYSSRLNISSDIINIPNDVVTVKKISFLQEILEKEYENNNPHIIKLLKNYCIKDDSNLINFILEILMVLDKFRDPNAFIDKYYEKFLSEKAIDDFVKDVNYKFQDVINLIKTNIELISNNKLVDKYNIYFKDLFNSESLEDVIYSIRNFERMPVAPRNLEDDDISLKDSIKKAKEKLTDLANNLDITNFYNYDVPNNRELIPYILDIVKKVNIKTNEFKKSKGCYSFNDIAMLAKDLLINNEDIRLEIKNKLKLIMIDEYQDTSEFQEEFINLIANDNVFVVGDVKQSIYGFRDAKPEQFIARYDKFKKDPSLGTSIDMNENYRSRKEINEDINKLFSEIMTLSTGGADYKKEHIIKSGNLNYENVRTKNNYGIKILPFDSEEKSDITAELEIDLVIKDIKNRINSKFQVCDFKNGEMYLRDCTYKDFTLLIFSKTKFDFIEEKFLNAGIPLNAIYDENIKKDDSIIVLINLIKLINELSKPKINENNVKHWFFSIARSFLFQLNDDELYDLAINNNYKNSKIYLKIADFSLKNNGKLINEVYLKILNEFDFINKFSSLGNAINKLKYSQIFYDRTKMMDDFGYSLEDFITYLEKIDKLELELESRKIGEATNAVNLTTIHKSKGLEYSIVYLPFAFRKRKKDSTKLFFVDKNDGFWLPSLYHPKNYSLEAFMDYKFKHDYTYNEVIRLLYVALTRAKEEIIIPININEKKGNCKPTRLDKLSRLYRVTTVGDAFICADLKFPESDFYKLKIKDEIKKENKKITDKIYFKNNNFKFDKKEKYRPSKLLKEDYDIEALKFGTHLHLIMEIIDFKTKDISFIKDEKIYKIIEKVINNELFKDLDNSNIYKEYEYFDKEEGINGIIDLFIEHDNYIDIIDYKTKNILDLEYDEQLNTYRRYLEKVFNKKCNCYLLSLVDNKLRKVEK